jgi:cytosine/adenosine deaminase-related metal-dependent hydrolase
VTLGVSLSDMMVGGREQARAEVEAAREMGCRITVHTNCFKAPDAFSEIQVLREHNLMGADLVFVHVNQATDEELKAVVDSGGAISATPETEMQMGIGHPVWGAEAMGLGNQIGTLTVGKQADIILIRLDDINTMPVNDPVATVVMHAHPAMLTLCS